MVFSFLKEDNLSQKFSAAKTYTESLTVPFPEFDRIARNVPLKGKDPRYPNTTDGTTASIVRKLGKRVVQQLPTGTVESDNDDAWLPIVAGFVYANKILPFANIEYDLIQKCWQVIERGGTFGATATYTPFVNHDGYFCPDLILPYWGDVFIQPGKKSGYDCDYVFIRSWWQEDDISALIDGEKKRAKEAKTRGEQYDSSWDLKALEKAKDMSSNKDEKAKTPHEEERNVNAEGIPVITGFQNGVGATFFTFLIGGDTNEVTIVRRKKNKDPRGKYPIDWYYHDTDGANPLGRGIVELIGGLQNLIDSDMQMYQFNRALMLAPPVIKRGNFSKKKIVYAPNAIIDVGSDPLADVKPLDVDTSAVINYPDLYGLQKSQLLNLVSSPDTSISAEVGNPGFGKTPTAINAQQANMSVDDNFIRKMFEAWFENWSETAINMYFTERSGVEELQLDDDTAQELRKLITDGKLDPNFVSDDNKIMINFDTDTPALKFRVDASTSKMKDDDTQLNALQGLIGTLDSSPMLSQAVPIEKQLAAWNRIVSNSAVEDPEELSVDIEEFKMQQVQAQALAQQQADTQTMQAQTAQTALQQQPVQPQMQPQQAPQSGRPDQAEVDQVTAELQQMGVPDDLIAQAHDMLDGGYTADDVLTAIQGVMQHA